MTGRSASTAGRCTASAATATTTDRLGEPLCADCYRYTDHVLWQWHAPELWRRYTQLVRTALARRAGLTGKDFKERARLAYTKVVEFQARGVIHVHVVVRLDGPDGPESPPLVGLDADDLAAAIHEVAETPAPHRHARGHRARSRCAGASRSTPGPSRRAAGRDDIEGQAHPEQVAAYLAKYLTKSTEDFGLDGHGRVHSATDARYLGASDHAIRLIEAAEHLAATAGPKLRAARRALRHPRLPGPPHHQDAPLLDDLQGAAPGPPRLAHPPPPGRRRPRRAARRRRPRRRRRRGHRRVRLGLRRHRLPHHRTGRPGPGLGRRRPGERGTDAGSPERTSSLSSWPPIPDGWSRRVKAEERSVP